MEEENEKKIDEEVKKLFPDADDGFTGIAVPEHASRKTRLSKARVILLTLCSSDNGEAIDVLRTVLSVIDSRAYIGFK